MSEPAKSAFMPREELIEKVVSKRQMTIGMPRDKKEEEKRISLTPEAVRILVDAGHEIYVESGAGAASGYKDTDYSENGAVVTDMPQKAYECDVVIKVAPFTDRDAEILKGNQILISFMNAHTMTEETLSALIRKRVTALASEKIRDRDGLFPVVESMSEISGIACVLLASEYLSNVTGGKGVMLGGVTGVSPTEVVILGANTAGEYAARAVRGLGAVVRIFDNSVQRLRRFQDLIGQRLYTSTFHPQALQKVLRTADVVICSFDPEDSKPACHITEEMVKGMKQGSVIIDLTPEAGRCVDTVECRTAKNPMYEKYGVVHYCAWSLPSRVPKTASIALSNVFRQVLEDIAEAGSITTMLKFNMGMRNGVYLYNGILTNETLGQKFGVLSKDINLLLAAF